MAATAVNAATFGPIDAVRSFLPIADYGLPADCNSAALVAHDGSILTAAYELDQARERAA